MRRHRLVLLLGLFTILTIAASAAVVLIFDEDIPQDAASVTDPSPPQVEPAPAPPEPATHTVLSARAPIAVGTLLTPDVVGSLAVHGDTLDEDWIVVETAAPGVDDVTPASDRGAQVRARIADFAGQVAREAIPAGSPIPGTSLLASTDPGFLATVLAPGMRAVTVELADATRRAGLLRAGDEVDVIVVMDAGPGDAAGYARRIMDDVRVVAVGRCAELRDRAGCTAEGTATLEVDPTRADRLVLANDRGRIALALRARRDTRSDAPSFGHAAGLDDVLLPDGGGRAARRIDHWVAGLVADARRQAEERNSALEDARLRVIRVFRGDGSTEDVKVRAMGRTPTATSLVSAALRRAGNTGPAVVGRP